MLGIFRFAYDVMKFRIAFIISILCGACLLSYPVFAQKQAELDSLVRLLQANTKQDTMRVKLLNQLCWANRNTNMIEGIEYGKEASQLAQTIRYYKGACEALNFLGVSYRNMGDYAKAISCFYEALSIAEKHSVIVQIAYSNNNVGDILKYQKKFKEALPYAEKALETFIQLNDKRGMGFAYVRLGETYQGLEIYEKAIDAFQKSVNIREKLKDKDALSALSTSYNRMGIVYSQNKEYETSLKAHQKALEIAEAEDEKLIVAGTLDYIAWVYIRQKKYEEARKLAMRELEIANTLKSMPLERNVYFTLSQIAEDTQDLKAALLYHKRFVALNDSIQNSDKTTQTARMQAIYDVKKKDKENSQLKLQHEQSQLIIVFIVLILGLTLLMGLLILRSRQKQMRLNANIKQKNETLMMLSKNAQIQKGDWEEALKVISESVAYTLSVERVSIWHYEGEPTQRLVCLDLYDKETRQHSGTNTLHAKDYPIYFQAISNHVLIRANNAFENDYTVELTENYLKPLNIKSLLDIPIFSETGLWGMICCEVKHKPHKWHDHEVTFAKSIADLLTIAHKSHQRKIAEAELQKQYEKVIELNATIERKKSKIEKNISILVQISKNEAITNGSWEVLGREITKAVVDALEVEACELWYHNFQSQYFDCVGKHSRQETYLPTSLHLPIFTEMLKSDNPLVVENIAESTALDETSKQHFLQQNAQALILYPNLLSDQQKGVMLVLSKEARQWDAEDLAFMKSMDDEMMIAYQGFRRQQAQERIEKQSKEIAEKNESLRTTLRLIKQEQKRTDELLLNILPFEIAEELRSEGSATPRHYDLVTVIFTDLKGFTKIAETLSPTQIIEELNTCFLAFDEICGKYNLEKIKTIGDAYMCAGGIPAPNTSNPVDAVSAAIEMHKWMNKWAENKKAEGKDAWEIRIGVHTGEVVAGVVGKKKFAYDIWGDTVNTASRMESSGEIGKINISGATYELVKHKFNCTFRGKIKAKNKGEVDMYFVEGRVA
ncbi:MAG: GAF domain-containing protein [Bacteroidetes bacterium]|nr:MAG: GAF domain-containing protein [Bacteroidota bacterium]